MCRTSSSVNVSLITELGEEGGPLGGTGVRGGGWGVQTLVSHLKCYAVFWGLVI